MVERYTAQNGGPRVDVSIRQTPALTDNNDRHPERTVAKYVAAAFDDAGYSYDVSFGYDPFDTGVEKSVCGDDSAYVEWSEAVFGRDVADLAKDSNILLTNAEGGGCGAVGGPVSTAPGYHIDETVDVKPSGSSSIQYNINTSLHEITHNLGLGHDLRDDVSGQQYTGLGWNEPLTIYGYTIPWFGTWHETPNFSGGAPTTNFCGQDIPERKYDTIVYHQRFTECTADNFEVEDDTWYQNT